jgi:hypothetical protein
MVRARAFWTALGVRARGDVVPVTDAAKLQEAARRTNLVRLALGAALVAACLGAFFAAPSDAGRRFLPPNAVGVVVLDVSSSIQPDTYYRIEQTLATIAASRSRLGLVLFSDVAYEALPPGTPSDQVRPLLRFFAPPTADDAKAAEEELPRTPWDQWFSGGTRISGGLYLAAHMLKKQHVKRGAIILISDLNDDPVDIGRTIEAVAYVSQQDLDLEIVGLNPRAQDLDFWRRLLGDDAIFKTASLPTAEQAAGKIEVSGTFSHALLAFAALAVVLLAVNEWWAEPLRWRRLSA